MKFLGVGKVVGRWGTPCGPKLATLSLFVPGHRMSLESMLVGQAANGKNLLCDPPNTLKITHVLREK